MMPLGLFWIGLLTAVEPVPVAAVQSSAAPIRIWVNNSRQFREGERAQVQVETDGDGYLLVLNADPDGRVRVLFPLSPGDDNFVRGGHRYEIRGRGDRDESFVAGGEGEGFVYAAVSEDPFRFDEYDVGGNWDYDRISIRRSREVEPEVTDLVQRMAGDRGFDYDLVSYRVYGAYSGSRYYTTAWYPQPYGYWDDYYCDWWYRPSLFGCRPGFYLGIGYNPYRYGYGYGYYPFGYGYGYGYGSGWPYYRNRNYSNRNWPVVVGRPRGYTIVRRNNGGSGYIGRRNGTWSGSLPEGRGNRDGGRRGGWEGRDRGGRGEVDGGRGSRPSGGDRARGRRSRGGDFEVPNIERDRGGSARPPVQLDDRARGRRVETDAINVERERSGLARPPVRFDDRPRTEGSEVRGDRGGVDIRPRERSYDPPPARRSGGDDSPRIERRGGGWDGPRSEPRSEPRSVDRPRYDPPPRVDRPSPPPPPRVDRQPPPPRVDRPSYSAPRGDRSPPSRGGDGGGRARGRGRG